MANDAHVTEKYVRMMKTTSRISYVHVLNGWRQFSSEITGDASRILPQALNNSL